MGLRERIARFIAPNMLGADQVKALVAEEVKQARQALPLSLDYDPKNEGYRRISDTVQNRDITPIAQDYMFELAYYLYDTSGLVKRFARDTKNFVLGEGVTVTVENDDETKSAEAWIKKFWDDPINACDIRLEKRIEFFGLLGEQCWPVVINPVDGFVRTSYIDPSNIDQVYAAPEWPEIPTAVKLKGTAELPGAVLQCVRPEWDPRKREFNRLVGNCFYWSINNPPNALRGRSDMIQSFDFINSLEENLFSEGDRIAQIKSFIWDVTINGADETALKEFLQKNKSPKPGSTRAHNQNVVWQAIAPDLKMHDSKSYFDTAKTYLAACMNRPDSWLGSGGKAYQTEAELMGEPTFKDLGSRQRFVKYILEYLLKFVLDQAVLKGSLKEEPKKPLKAVVSMPDMAEKDLTPLVTALYQFAQALTLAQTSGWIREETATRLFLSVAQRVGLEIDVAEEIAKTAKAALEKDPNVTKDYAAREAIIAELVARVGRRASEQ
ncbi:MAG: hypothetical protein AB9866_10965 [Syntrophobacteraceae bacterium]